MRKLLVANLAILLFASSAFAAGSFDMDFSKTGLTVYGSKTDAATAGANQKTIGKTSTGVGVGIISTAQGYAVVTQHKSGNKAYGSSHDSTAVFMNDAKQGEAKLAKPSQIGSGDFVASGSSWTTM